MNVGRGDKTLVSKPASDSSLWLQSPCFCHGMCHYEGTRNVFSLRSYILRKRDHSLWVSTILSFSGALVRLTGVFPWRMAPGPGLCNSGQEAPARAYLRPPGKWERGRNLAGSFILLSFFSSILKCGEMCSLTIAASCKKYCRPANHPAKPAIP